MLGIRRWSLPAVFLMAFSALSPAFCESSALSNEQMASQIQLQQQAASSFIPQMPKLEAKAYVLMEANTGTILASSNADERLAPASLTKIMTMYVVSDAMRQGKVHLEDKVSISEKAWRTGGSKMFVKVGDQIPLEELVKGVIISSGNDASIALAEHVAGTEEAFAELMNAHAQRLHMVGSHFSDSNGLPSENHYSTAHDLATLARAVITEFPDHYKTWYSQKWFVFNNIRQPNRNRLLWRESWIDGMKTGHTDEAGFCLVASGERNGMRLISVVLGAASDKSRTEQSLKLLNWGFRFFENRVVFDNNQPLSEPKVWYGAQRTVPVGLSHPLKITLPQGAHKNLTPTLVLDQPIKAPLKAGQAVGHYELRYKDQLLVNEPVVALSAVEEAGWFTRFGDRVSLWLNKTPAHG